MTSKSLLLTFLTTLLLASAGFLAVNRYQGEVEINLSLTGNDQGSFTYFAFEREWPGTVCKLNKCKEGQMGQFDSKNFNLHGLWPSGLETNVCSYPQDCDNTHFSFSNINKSTTEYMNFYWVGLYSSTQSFLDHEWTKHGTCYTNDQNDFFTLATNLHAQYNPIPALEKAGIIPSDTESYSVQQVQNALQDSFGGPVSMACKFKDGQQMFFAFDMYFDKNLSGIVPQPCKKNSSCVYTRPLLFPTVSY